MIDRHQTIFKSGAEQRIHIWRGGGGGGGGHEKFRRN